MDSNCDPIKVDDREEKRFACTDEFSSDLYWTMEEHRFARRRAGCNGLLVRSKYPRQVEALARLYQTSSCHDGNDMSSSGTDGNVSDDSASIDTTDFQTMRMWSRSKARGLEESVLPQMRQNRQRAVNAVLARQAQTRQLDMARRRSAYSMPPHKRQRLEEITSTQESLRQHSMAASQRSREFAARLGLGDAMAAYNL
jgi:hypothetical protein